MTKEEIRSAWKATPFVPFELRLADGTVHPVPTPDHIGISPSGSALVLHKDDGSARIIDMAQILEIITKHT